jgi:hypothetical protein
MQPLEVVGHVVHMEIYDHRLGLGYSRLARLGKVKDFFFSDTGSKSGQQGVLDQGSIQ